MYVETAVADPPKGFRACQITICFESMDELEKVFRLFAQATHSFQVYKELRDMVADFGGNNGV